MDMLTLLIVLMGVVTLMWIVASYTEIEKLKITVYGDGNKKLFSLWEKLKRCSTESGKHFKNVGHAWEVTFAGQIQKLDENKIYYLAYPCTTGGKKARCCHA